MLLNMKDSVDDEADKMAADILIPAKEWDSFISFKNYSARSINNFADKIGIHPCIVLGRLYKEKKLEYGTYNKQFNVQYKISAN